MAAGAWHLYSNVMLAESKKLIDFSSDAFVLVLTTNSYVPNFSTDTQWSAASANELPAANGYTAGGVLLTVTTTLAADADTIAYSNSPNWAALAATFRWGLIVHRAGASLASTDLLIAGSDLGGGSSLVTNGSFTVNAGTITVKTHTP
jgi:hypothetical protein